MCLARLVKNNTYKLYILSNMLYALIIFKIFCMLYCKMNKNNKHS